MKIAKIVKSLGPGLLYAGAAVGVSHLVQSTRAGADYGFSLIIVIILAHIIKYPFFQFGPRYASATGKSLIHGYASIGKWAVYLFFLLTLSTVFTIQAAITVVTAGLTVNIFGLSMDPMSVGIIILIFSTSILMIGRYALLDKMIKYIIIILSVSTIIAVFSALGNPSKAVIEDTGFDISQATAVAFLIAFLGWMPAPLDLSVWHSLWTSAKNDGKKQKDLKATMIDFNIGFFGTAILAICFLSLGALIMHNSGENLSKSGAVFAGQLIDMYTSTIGPWAYWVIAIAALTTMISTSLTALDANPRVIATTITNLSEETSLAKFKKQYWIWLVVILLGTVVLMKYMSESMQFMVDLATTLSFVTAPLIAYLNYRVIIGKNIPDHAKISKRMRIYSLVNLILLTGFGVFYIVWKLILN